MNTKPTTPDDDDRDLPEAWVTVQLLPPSAGMLFASFVVTNSDKVPPYEVRVRPVDFVALQHITDEDDMIESRIVPVVIDPTGEPIYLDGGKSGGPDHGFVGVGPNDEFCRDFGATYLQSLIMTPVNVVPAALEAAATAAPASEPEPTEGGPNAA